MAATGLMSPQYVAYPCFGELLRIQRPDETALARGRSRAIPAQLGSCRTLPPRMDEDA